MEPDNDIFDDGGAFNWDVEQNTNQFGDQRGFAKVGYALGGELYSH